jgi:N-acetylglucosaminyldiphosphoundecaprenol N-acetyl-beta-D-mannosaminyltransferase
MSEMLFGGGGRRWRILGIRVDATTLRMAAARVLGWAGQGCSRYVCFANVSTIMGACDATDYRNVLDRADMVTADGMPLVWLLRLLGVRGASRVYGPDLVPVICEGAVAAGIPVGFYGGSEPALDSLTFCVRRRFPTIDIAYARSPPFRALTREEDQRVVDDVNSSGVRILFVGLGSPKQDFWMHAHLGRVNAVMLGVGAAFDFLGGTKPQAPRWMQRSGLEWLFRLATEPRRLWRRYLYHNPRFIVLALAQLLRARINEHRRSA